MPPVVGISCLAAGADQIFATLVKKHGGRLHVILPARRYEESFEASEDLEGFRTLLAQADTVTAPLFDEPTEDAYMAAGRRVVDLADRMIAVWDRRRGRPGGTADVVRYARERNVPTEIIWPEGAQRPKASTHR